MTSRRKSLFSLHGKQDGKEDESSSSSSSENLGQVTIADAAGSELQAAATVLNDGRIDVKLNQKAFKLTKSLKKRSYLSTSPLGEHLTRRNKNYETTFKSVLGRYVGIPPLNIAIHIVGSRGDVQPFIAIGQVLMKEPYGHRVRICTHPVFKDFVEENGLEFFSIGGDPATLMAYMVKNPGLMPGRESWKAGDVGKRRADIAEILEGCWRSCFEAGDGMGGERKCPTVDSRTEKTDRLFIADAIIANPPSYGHIHCAEKLGIPLHMMFTMPWSPTQYFPHPLASLETNNSDPSLANYISYTLMELLAWQGLGDVINGFRMKTLHLDPISPLWGHMLLARMKVPYTYTWSSALIPKPPDWGSHINISGFSFLPTPSTYTPPASLMEFLSAGPPPIYIGFGSIVVDHPDQLTALIFAAVKKAGVRALVSKGWGGLGGDDAPENVYLLGNCPHDWLFPHVSCVIHHGGAGTSAIGIALGKPTLVIPFFGDQPFWGSMIFRAGAGPEPVPFKKLTADILAESIGRALEADIGENVREMSEKIAGEDGAGDAARSFHQSLNYDSMRCLLSPERVAVWRVRRTNLRLSGLATATLIDNGYMTIKDMKLIKHRDWYIDEGASNPVSGVIASVSSAVTNTIISFTSYSRDLHTTIHKPAPDPTIANSCPNTGPVLEHSTTLGELPSRNPLQAVVHYPPDHIERVAYSMASNTLPTKRKKPKPKPQPIAEEDPNADPNKSPQTPTPKRTPTFPLRRPPTHRSVAEKEKARNQPHSKTYEAAHETGDLLSNIASTGLKAPVAFLYNLANGFHNAPSFILHDETVRRRDNITGLGSGIKAAVRGGGYNLFDGVTGVVMHPVRGVKRDGVKGGLKGVGKGVGGLVLKSVAAGVGVPAYVLKGVERQVERRLDRDLRARVLEVRLRQGLAAFERASEREKEEILGRWKEFEGGKLGSLRGL